MTGTSAVSVQMHNGVFIPGKQPPESSSVLAGTIARVPIEHKPANEQHVVEVNGTVHSKHVYFVDALKAALLLRYSSPEDNIKIRDSESEKPSGNLTA